jgi:hypothetical protein
MLATVRGDLGDFKCDLWFMKRHEANHHNIIAPYSFITIPQGRPDQAAHYYPLSPKLGASPLTWHLADLGVKVIFIYTIIHL